eukprot:TRINITY_DN431_c0_g1_i2.p1 TRINITY_DN431_c0_g1~~TRINITY_DN431_c0_g1_i2.p1  ORF type:complete len:196 (+),score=4.31 TRINITY_DN431_c0_g1_i2:135-722(+)
MGTTGGVWPLLVAAAMSLIVALSSMPGVDARLPPLSIDLDFVTEIEFWHKFDHAGYKTVFGTVGAWGEGQAIDYAVLDAKDKEIGRARGLGISDSVKGNGIQELYTDTFTGGTYAGSSLTFGGHWNQTLKDNELPVTGGTGVFKYVTGSAVFSLQMRGNDVYFHVNGQLKHVNTGWFKNIRGGTGLLAIRPVRYL